MAGIFAVLALTAICPLVIKKIEQNLEVFLFVMGLAAAVFAHALTLQNLEEIFTNYLLYLITGAVLVVSFLFRLFERKINLFIDFLLEHISLNIFNFILIVALGLLSSVITAIIASLLLTEVLSILPMTRKGKIHIAVISCFSIGLGAVLTPVGEPLATVVVSKLDASFFYIADTVGVYVLIGILLMGLLGVVVTHSHNKTAIGEHDIPLYTPEHESSKHIVIRAAKIFLFVVALELLGFGFKPVIDTYIIHWSNSLLYFANLLSAILDNATLAAAEVSPAMTALQIKAVLISLLISGGILITGNIPNIITAGRMKITMKEWAKCGLPIGAALLCICYAALFFL